MANLVIGAAGAAVGFFFGGPTGAQIGWVLGSAIGGSLKKIDQRQTADFTTITAAYGTPIPVVFGKQRVAPNIFWSQEPKAYDIKSKAGKGGPTTVTNGYTISCAMGLCAGPIVGISRVWIGEKLVVDSSLTVSDLPGTLYLGTDDQLPDPTITAVEGIGNVPAYRGLAYLVLKDWDITGFGNTLPQMTFEVLKAV